MQLLPTPVILSCSFVLWACGFGAAGLLLAAATRLHGATFGGFAPGLALLLWGLGSAVAVLARWPRARLCFLVWAAATIVCLGLGALGSRIEASLAVPCIASALLAALPVARKTHPAS